MKVAPGSASARTSMTRSSVTVLKIGGSVITDKNKVATPRPGQIDRIAAEIKAGMSTPLVLVHGAGSFGHHQAREFGLKAGLNATSIRGIMPTHNAVRELSDMIIGALYENGVYAAPVHPLSSCVLRNGRIERMCTDVIQGMLAAGLVPVLHGDVAADSARGIDVLSGDQLVTYLAKALGAKNVGIGTNVDGVYAKDFKIIRAITPSNLDAILESLAGSGGVDVTGGMYGKVMELMELANAGITSCVFNAERPGNVTRFLKGENVEGTLIKGD